jgi:hypothetical protein
MMSSETLNRILADHSVPSRDRPAMRRFVLDKSKPTRPVLQRLLAHRGAIKAILTELSNTYWAEKGIKFPPPDYQSPRSAA